MVKYFKGKPSQYVIKYVSGRIRKKGVGKSFFYLKYHTNIVAIPAMTIDSNFLFNEITKNFQNITLQGHFTYHIKDPKKMSTILDFSIDPNTMNYLSEDPEKVDLRIQNVVQLETRGEIQKLDLEESLTMSAGLASKVLEKAKDHPIFSEMGVELLSITFNTIRPTPEMSRALEADYREKLQKKADEAIYDRRAAAVEQERKIKENELKTQITLEDKRKSLIALHGENRIKDAEFKSKAKELELDPFKKLEPKLLLALALNNLALEAKKIGNLTITSEILSQILDQK